MTPSEKSIAMYNDFLERKNKYDNELSDYTYCKTILLNDDKDEMCISTDRQNLIFKNDATKKYSIIDVNHIDVNQLLECEVLENNTVIAKGGVGRAIVGGVGAIVGATTVKRKTITSYKIRIITKNIEIPIFLYTVKSFEIAQESYGLIISLLSQLAYSE